jgi:hypothetical protein
MSARRDRTDRRNLNIEEAQSLLFTDFQNRADEYGWPFPDYDDAEYGEPYDADIMRRTDTDLHIYRGTQIFGSEPMM